MVDDGSLRLLLGIYLMSIVGLGVLACVVANIIVIVVVSEESILVFIGERESVIVAQGLYALTNGVEIYLVVKVFFLCHIHLY